MNALILVKKLKKIKHQKQNELLLMENKRWNLKVNYMAILSMGFEIVIITHLKCLKQLLILQFKFNFTKHKQKKINGLFNYTENINFIKAKCFLF